MSRQEFLRSRVATVASYKNLGVSQEAGINYSIAQHFSYDLSGNLKTLTYDMPALIDVQQRYKRIDYDFDLYSGKVTTVSYNRSFADQFYQKYTYDADNRLIQVETSKDGLLWDIDAGYKYYSHGPLARINLGDLSVQGVDFAYNLQGWLKSINGDTPHPANDIGQDEGSGGNGNLNQPDLFRSTLYYYNNDYKPIDASDNDVMTNNNEPLLRIPDQQLGRSLYNGNITAAVTIPGYFPSLYTDYTYDQLNRIRYATYKLPDYDPNTTSILRSFTQWNGQTATSQPSWVHTDNIYRTSYNYDRDGNIKKLMRYGLKHNDMYNYANGQVYIMDSLQYYYQLEGTINATNRLINYTDKSYHQTLSSTNFNNDVQKFDPPNPLVSRFFYDANGNLIKDNSNFLSNIVWNGFGKLKEVRRQSPAQFSMTYKYDAMNNRFMKTTNDEANFARTSDIYIRDAQGNILAVYRQFQRYQIGNIWPQMVGMLKVSPTFGQDFYNATQNYSGFQSALLQTTLDSSFDYAEGLMSSQPASFYLNNNQAIREGVLRNTPGLIEDILVAKDSIVYNTLSGFDEEMFIPIVSQIGDKRLHYIPLITGVGGDTAIMNEIMTLTGGDEISSLEEFVDAFDARVIALGQSTIIDVLKPIFDNEDFKSSILKRMLQDSLYLYEENALLTDHSINKRLREKLIADDNPEQLQWYFDTYRSDGGSLINLNSTAAERLGSIYTSSPISFINGLGSQSGSELIIGSALSELEGMSALSFLTDFITSNPAEPTYANINLAEILVYNKLFLAEHHMYGSSRLGIKSYFPDQYLFKWDASKTLAQNQSMLEWSAFNYRSPWYSAIYNSLINSN
ncbi:MAG: RHS repeat protein, partial [Pedobacter sp.]